MFARLYVPSYETDNTQEGFISIHYPDVQYILTIFKD